MIQGAVSPYGFSFAARRRWVVGVATALGAHLAVAAGMLNWVGVQPIELPPAMVMVDLAPLPAAPPAEPAPVPPAPPMPEIETPPPLAEIPEVEPLPEPAPVPEQPPLQLETPPPLASVRDVEPLPELEAVPLPRPPPPKPRKPPPRPAKQEPPSPEAAPAPRIPVPPAPPAPSRPVAPPARVAAAPPPVSRPSNALPTYQSDLLAHLEQHKRYPRAAQLRRQEGSAYLRFTISRDGRVLSYRLERSSGHDLLDREALAMIERAQPLPPFPPEFPEQRLEFVVPVQFSLR